VNVELGNWRGIFGAPGITKEQREALIKLVKAATGHAGLEIDAREAWLDTGLSRRRRVRQVPRGRHQACRGHHRVARPEKVAA
jgi:hypothetical protein